MDESPARTVGRGSGQGVVGLDIGARRGDVVVARVREGGPAHTAGVMAGDRVVRVDDVATDGLTRKEVAARMRGPANTQVSLWVKRAGATEPLCFSLQRAPAPELQPLPAGTRRFLLGLLALVGSIALVVALLVWWSRDHKEAARAYIDSLREGDPRAAYQALADADGRGITYESWLETMNTSLLMRATAFHVASTRKASAGHGCVRGAVVVDSNDVPLTVYTLERAGQVRVHSVITNAEHNVGSEARPWECGR